MPTSQDPCPLPASTPHMLPHHLTLPCPLLAPMRAVWQSLSGAQAVLVRQRALDILLVVGLAAMQHLIYLAFNFVMLMWVTGPDPSGIQFLHAPEGWQLLLVGRPGTTPCLGLKPELGSRGWWPMWWLPLPGHRCSQGCWQGAASPHSCL